MLSIAKKLCLTVEGSLSVAMETNGRGYHGFVVELPGAFVRDPTEGEAVAKTRVEARKYLAWLDQKPASLPEPRVVETHRCRLMVEDADCEILLSEDRRPMSSEELGQMVQLARYSGFTFNKLCDSAQLPDWVDEARVRTTFYGQNKKTIREVFDHVKSTQHYYLSRTGIRTTANKTESFMRIRDLCLDKLTSIFNRDGNSKVYTVENEAWTLKKILRRFIWHDRIHGKAITRILEKQRQLGLIERYKDTFRFGIGSDKP